MTAGLGLTHSERSLVCFLLTVAAGRPLSSQSSSAGSGFQHLQLLVNVRRTGVCYNHGCDDQPLDEGVRKQAREDQVKERVPLYVPLTCSQLFLKAEKISQTNFVSD